MVQIQEQDSALCAFSGAEESNHQGFTGAGFLNVSNAIGESIVWAVNAKNAGNYSIGVRYANGGNGPRGGALRLSASTADGLANIDAITFEGAGLSTGKCANPPANTTGVFPVPGSMGNNPDTFLRINFDAKPAINTGFVDIIDAANNQRVDRINVQADKETAQVGSRKRRDGDALITTLVQVVDNAIVINPHSERLGYNKTYNVVINSGVFRGKVSGWQFTTKSAAPTAATVTVDDDGPADFGSVQGALDYIMKNHGGTTRAQINIKNGVYLGLLQLSNKSNLKIVGESKQNTRIIARNGNNLNPGDNTRALIEIRGGDLIEFENFSMRNNIPRSVGGQAEVIYYNSGGRITMKNMAFYSEQDTILVKGSGYSWFYNSLISGNVDFIWGSPKVALFENSEIRSVGDSQSPGSDVGGYVLQSRTPSGALGFVFLNSKFTRGKGPAGNTPGTGKTTLGRGAGKTNTQDNAAFINCQMDINGRWSVYKLNGSQVNQYYRDRATIFKTGGSGWNPTP